MRDFFKLYICVAAVLFPLDMIWLKSAHGFYASQMGELLLDKPRLVAAAGFYLFYVVGIVVFAVSPQTPTGTAWQAALLGALLGLVAYGTYDLTNYATLKGFPLKLAMVDMTWGMVLTALSAGLGHELARRGWLTSWL